MNNALDILKHSSPQQILSYIDSALEYHSIQEIVTQKHFKPIPKMLEYYKAALGSSERLILGGNRSGKTYNVLEEGYYHVTGLYPEEWWPGYRFNRPIIAILASYRLTDTRDILQKKLFEGDIQDNIPPIIHESLIVSRANTSLKGAYDYVDIRHISGGVSRIYFKAYKQGASSFQGVKADWIHLDESVGFDVYQESLLRTASFNESKTFINVTMWPEKGQDELVCHFMNNGNADEIANNRFYMHLSWDDNIHMPESEKIRLEQSIPEWQREARIKGIPVFGQGKVFIQPESEIFIKPFDLRDPRYRHFAYIYGLDPSATSGGTWGFVLLAYDRDNDFVYACRDYKLSNVTPSEHSSNMSRIIPFLGCYGMCDPAGAGENQHTKESTIEFLQNTCGLKLIKANKVNGTKEAVIDSIYERIRRGTFKIMYDPETNSGCTNLVKEWRQYSRDEKGQIIKKNDHCIDALFYSYNGLEHAINENYSIAVNSRSTSPTYV